MPKPNDPALHFGADDRAGDFQIVGAKLDTPVNTTFTDQVQHLTFAERIIARRFHLSPHMAREICIMAELGSRHD